MHHFPFLLAVAYATLSQSSPITTRGVHLKVPNCLKDVCYHATHPELFALGQKCSGTFVASDGQASGVTIPANLMYVKAVNFTLESDRITVPSTYNALFGLMR